MVPQYEWEIVPLKFDFFISNLLHQMIGMGSLMLVHGSSVILHPSLSPRCRHLSICWPPSSNNFEGPYFRYVFHCLESAGVGAYHFTIVYLMKLDESTSLLSKRYFARVTIEVDTSRPLILGTKLISGRWTSLSASSSLTMKTFIFSIPIVGKLGKVH